MATTRTKRGGDAAWMNRVEVLPYTDSNSNLLPRWCGQGSTAWFTSDLSATSVKYLAEDLTAPADSAWGPLLKKYGRSGMATLAEPGKDGLLPRSGQPLDRILLHAMQSNTLLKLDEAAAWVQRFLSRGYGLNRGSYQQVTQASLMVWDDPQSTALRPATRNDLSAFGSLTNRTLKLGHIGGELPEVTVFDAWKEPHVAQLINTSRWLYALPYTTDIGEDEMGSHTLRLVHDTYLNGGVLNSLLREAGVSPTEAYVAWHPGDIRHIRLPGLTERQERLLRLVIATTSRREFRARLPTVADRLVRITPDPAARDRGYQVPSLFLLINAPSAVVVERVEPGWSGYGAGEVTLNGVPVQMSRTDLLSDRMDEHTRAMEFTRIGMFDLYLEWRDALDALNADEADDINNDESEEE